MSVAPIYVFPANDKPSLPLFDVPLIKATPQSVKAYGCLVDDVENFQIEIVRWPALGWRPVDSDSGDEGGVTEGIFTGEWHGDTLHGRNAAVGGDYVLGWSCDPQEASDEEQTIPREKVLLWHMNYHPDGGQMFFPRKKAPFVVPVALPGDDLKPEKVVAFWCDGSQGLYIHPNIWHEGVFPCNNHQTFYDRQGKVHARVSCDIGKEFGVYLSVPLPLTY